MCSPRQRQTALHSLCPFGQRRTSFRSVRWTEREPPTCCARCAAFYIPYRPAEPTAIVMVFVVMLTPVLHLVDSASAEYAHHLWTSSCAQTRRPRSFTQRALLAPLQFRPLTSSQPPHSFFRTNRLRSSHHECSQHCTRTPHITPLPPPVELLRLPPAAIVFSCFVAHVDIGLGAHSCQRASPPAAVELPCSRACPSSPKLMF